MVVCYCCFCSANAIQNVVIIVCVVSVCFSLGVVGFNYDFSSFKGKRPSMEDYFVANISDVDGQMVSFFGVFDGTRHDLDYFWVAEAAKKMMS
ncbi:hypothetical protein GBA52_000246 [Prunus armeniaca]|nr:hypothetical protein GBA52_000246 [Prunus armeniaca]